MAPSRISLPHPSFPKPSVSRQTVLTLPYRVVRTPLSALDRLVVQRLPETSASRRAFEHTIGRVDAFVDHSTAAAASAGTAIARTVRSTEHATAVAVKATANRVAPRKSTATDRLTANESDSGRALHADAPPNAPVKASNSALPKATAPAPAKPPTTKPAKATAQQVTAKKAAARKAARRSAPQPDTRANKSVASLALELAETEAVAEAREHRAEQQVDETLVANSSTDRTAASTDDPTTADGLPPSSQESLPTAKDMGPKGS